VSTKFDIYAFIITTGDVQILNVDHKFISRKIIQLTLKNLFRNNAFIAAVLFRMSEFSTRIMVPLYKR
jgi:hypothetical protein